jgi:hypothetical protein
VDGHISRVTVAHLVFRWIARGWSLLSLGFVALFVLGQALHPTAPLPTTARDLIGLSLFPLGVCLGMILAWKWEALGGSIILGSLAAFYALLRFTDGRFPRGPYFALVAAPGDLFILSWAFRRLSSKSTDT